MGQDTPATWLLDVDGVLNVWGKPGWSASPWHTRVVVPYDDAGTLVAEFRLRWAPALITRIRRLHATGTVRIVWCTTWCPVAELLEELWGFPSLERAWSTHLHGYFAVEAKRAAARAVLAAGGRLIWTDDDAFPRAGPLVDELTADGRALLIKPDRRRGLQRDDLAAIESFAGADLARADFGGAATLA